MYSLLHCSTAAAAAAAAADPACRLTAER